MSGDDVTLPVVLYDSTNARVNWGRWVSDCTSCTNAWAVDQSVILWMCRECWTVMRPVWPPDPAAIEWLLMQRPDPVTRNWQPGETLTDLLAENIAHGFGSAALEELTDGADVLTVADGRVISGALMPSIDRYRSLTGGRLELTGGN